MKCCFSAQLQREPEGGRLGSTGVPGSGLDATAGDAGGPGSPRSAFSHLSSQWWVSAGLQLFVSGCAI